MSLPVCARCGLRGCGSRDVWLPHNQGTEIVPGELCLTGQSSVERVDGRQQTRWCGAFSGLQ